MPTDARLVVAGLTPIEIPLDGSPEAWRFLYGPSDFLRSMDRIMVANEASSYGSDLRLPEQLDDLLFAFVSGRRLHYDQEFHTMEPGSDAVWELKTTDLRLFGWFLRRNHFACMNLVKADVVKGTGEYAAFSSLYGNIKREIIRKRKDLGCDTELCIYGTQPYDVISVRDRL